MDQNMFGMIKSLMTCKNPKDAITQIIGNVGGTNPMITNLMKMANSGDKNSIENFAKNICKEKGIDFDKEFSNFMKNFK